MQFPAQYWLDHFASRPFN